jgi:hypothetical protein
MLDIAGRLFRKTISLMEQRLHLKVNNAILIIETNKGEHMLCLKDDEYQNLIMMSRQFHKKLINAVGRTRYIAGIATCSRCLGTGLDTPNSYIPCKTCNGGGQVALVDPNILTAQDEPLTDYEQPNTNTDESLQVSE